MSGPKGQSGGGVCSLDGHRIACCGGAADGGLLCIALAVVGTRGDAEAASDALSPVFDAANMLVEFTVDKKEAGGGESGGLRRESKRAAHP